MVLRKKNEILHIGADQAGTEREKLFSDQIIDNSRSMVSIINRNYEYEKVNIPFCKAHRGGRSTFIGKSLPEIWGTEIFQSRIKSNIDLCFTGKTIRYDALFSTPESGNRYYEVVFRPIKTDTGEVTYAMAETFDITYGVLAGGIAHDFNNILATISGYAEMLHEDLPGNSPLKENTGKIMSAVSRARSLTNQILAYSSQVEQGKTNVDVSGILEETLGFIKPATPPEISIIAEIPGTRIHVYADPTQLFRVFLNLMTNAVQSMEGGGGTLFINVDITGGDHVKPVLKKEKVADQYVIITFRDTGTGIETSMIPRVFDPFFTTRGAVKGSGLGLSVVRGIITDLEGEITVLSNKNEGTIFAVYLPVTAE